MCFTVQPNAMMQFVGAETGSVLHPKSPGSGELEAEHSWYVEEGCFSFCQ